MSGNNKAAPENLPTADSPVESSQDKSSASRSQKRQSVDYKQAGRTEDIKPPKFNQAVSTKAAWLGLVLFFIGIVLGGAVGWALFANMSPAVMEPQPSAGPQEPSEPQEPQEPQLTPAQQRDQERQQELTDLRLALELYKNQAGRYPVSPEVSRSLDSDYALNVLVEQGHIDSIPADPLRQELNYYYGYQSENGQTYRLSAVAESPDTPCRQIRENLCIIEYGPEGLLNQAEPGSAESADKELGITNQEEIDTSDSSSKALATEDWKTYTNEEYGFQFRYPASWQEDKLAELLQAYKLTQAGTTVMSIVPAVVEGESNLLEGTYCADNLGEDPQRCEKLNTADGQPIVIDWIPFEDNLAIAVIDGRVHLIFKLPTSENKQLFRQLLSTFEFTQ